MKSYSDKVNVISISMIGEVGSSSSGDVVVTSND